MKQRGRLDAFALSAARGEVAGVVDAATLERVADRLAPEGGEAPVAYRVDGTVDGVGRPAIEVVLDGSVPLICQRCLRPFQWPVNQSTLLLLARSEEDLARLDGEDHEHEVVLATAPLDPAQLIEDELVLTLPFVPRCPEAECSALHGGAATEQVEERTESAFGALAKLRPGSKGLG